VDKQDQLAGFSSRGPRIGDGGLKPDIAAPGVDIVAARAAGTSMGTPVNDLYTAASGTSMATPHVAGVAALVWSYFPGCTAAQIASTLKKSALDLGVAGRDDETGAGLVQAKAAYDRIAAHGCAN
jgi:subtilisin family serine protease